MDIISLPAEIDHKKIDGKFRLVSIATQRAKELSLGGKPRLITKSKKVTTIAIEEAVQDKLEFITGEDARVAMEKAGKLDYRKLLEESRKMAAGEDLTELDESGAEFFQREAQLDRGFEPRQLGRVVPFESVAGTFQPVGQAQAAHAVAKAMADEHAQNGVQAAHVSGGAQGFDQHANMIALRAWPETARRGCAPGLTVP